MSLLTLSLGELTEHEVVAGRLGHMRFSDAAAIVKATLFQKAAKTLLADGLKADAACCALFVPGRVEMIGKHTDYAGGSSIVAAVEEGLCFVAVSRSDQQVVIHTLNLGDKTSFALDPDLHVPDNHWTNYPMTVVRRVCRNFPDHCRGMDIALVGDLTPAAGMSSSSAVVVGVFLVMSVLNGLDAVPLYRDNIRSNLELAEYLGTVENGQSYRTLDGDRGVGTFGGSEDHTAILCSQPAYLGHFSYCPTRFERAIKFSRDCILAIGFSGVIAEKTGQAKASYNRASGGVSQLVDLWRSQRGMSQQYLSDILRTGPEAVDLLRQCITRSKQSAPAELNSRLEHYLAESLMVNEAGAALAAGQMGQFGELMDRSMQLADELLANQIPETRELARLARAQGAFAASAFGAGFGGSVWALVEQEEADAFLSRWENEYAAAFPQREAQAHFWATFPGPSAFTLSAE